MTIQAMPLAFVQAADGKRWGNLRKDMYKECVVGPGLLWKHNLVEHPREGGERGRSKENEIGIE